MPAPAQTLRSDNRRELILESAAELFVRHGYGGTSMRDIAKATGMLSGSLYYHFASKEALLLSVFEEGVRLLSDAVDRALATSPDDPWERLQAAAQAHLGVLLDGSHFAQVVVRVLPGDAPGAQAALIALRDRYEARFHTVVEALPLTPDTDRSILRLMLLGAMNHTPVWFQPGRATPAELACHFIRNLRGTAAAVRP